MNAVAQLVLLTLDAAQPEQLQLSALEERVGKSISFRKSRQAPGHVAGAA
jgi:hypothetical protein